MAKVRAVSRVLRVIRIIIDADISGPVNILDRRNGKFFVHYANTDKRLDEWVPETMVLVSPNEPSSVAPETSIVVRETRKRKADRELNPPTLPEPSSEDPSIPAPSLYASTSWRESGLTEEEFDMQQHKGIMQTRNFDKVVFGDFSIKTW